MTNKGLRRSYADFNNIFFHFVDIIYDLINGGRGSCVCVGGGEGVPQLHLENLWAVLQKFYYKNLQS
jgi:hypothetical protein